MEEKLTGLSGRQYVIKDHIKSGGEGGVYHTDVPQLVAKLYDTSKINIDARMAELEQKINYMVNHPIPTRIPDGTVIVTWPQDALYKDGKFVGYIMPEVSGAKPIYMLNRGGKQANEVIPGYNWKTAISVAANLAYIVKYLHSKNVVIGDMNSDNLLVYSNGFVVVIDTDSFDIRDESQDLHFQCSVGTEEFLPPELQGCNLERKTVRFSKHTDEFALAVHIFQLLMNNMHPFNARVITDYKQSVPENNQNHNIVVGNCPFVRNIQGCKIPLGAPDMNKLLPDYLIQDFKNTFDYQLNPGDSDYMEKLKSYVERRTTADIWHGHLKQLANDPGLQPCSMNPEHYYLSEKGQCELCEAKKRMNQDISGPGKDDSQVIDPPKPKPNIFESIRKKIKPKKNTTKKIKPKKVAVGLGILAVILAVVLIGYQPMKTHVDYKSAINDFNRENYFEAAYEFERLGNYEESKEYWIKSMLHYIGGNFNNYDRTTYHFISTLMDFKDKDVLSVSILENCGADQEKIEEWYEELYTWRIEEAFVNTGKDDHENKNESFSNYDDWYAHFKITGGTPGETLSVYTVQKTGGKSTDPSYYNSDIKNPYKVEDSDWIDSNSWHFTYPSSAGSGLWTIAVFNAEDDTYIGSVTASHY